MLDCVKKGFYPFPHRPKGEQSYRHLLTNEKVLEMRRLWDSRSLLQKQIAIKFQVCPSTVSAVIRRAVWNHI
jgi:predicted DNA-binding protein (UPF0251 family)